MVSSILGSLTTEGGEPICVQFVNTVGSRRGATPNEYLHSPELLGKWLSERQLAESSVEIDAGLWQRALTLRDAIYRIFSARAAGSSPAAEDIETLNGEVCEALAKLELTTESTWELAAPPGADRALMIIALSAAALLTSPLAERVRECADAECGWLFLDTSKNRSRRWCSMSDCGNLAKARRFAERRKEKGRS